MKICWWLLGVLVVLAVFFEGLEAAPEPKRRKSGGSRSSSSSKSGGGLFGSLFGGSKKKQNNAGSSYPKQQYGNTNNNYPKQQYGNNNNYGNNYGNNMGSSGGGYGNNYKKKGSKMKTLKKAAVIGAVAYGGYQLGKLSTGYGHWNHHPRGYGFNDWNRDREIDGFMCRSTNDCNWLDPRLYCQDYELDFRPSALWFGGDVASIVGECACPRGMHFDDWEMQCRQNFFSGTVGIVVIVICVLIGLCCCCGCFFMANKMRN